LGSKKGIGIEKAYSTQRRKKGGKNTAATLKGKGRGLDTVVDP